MLISSALLLLLMIVSVTKVFSCIADLLGPLNENIIWEQVYTGSLVNIGIGFTLTIVLFFLVLFTFIPMGQYLGGLFENTPNIISAYSLNIGASIAGMWIFNLQSVMNFSPYLGILFAQLLLFPLLASRKKISRFLSVLILTGIVCLWSEQIINKSPRKIIWSPYQKLTLSEWPKKNIGPSGYKLEVNNTLYMGLLDLSDEYKDSLHEKIRKVMELPEWFDIRFVDLYRLPYILKPHAQDVLIVGAGGGNDVAAAVRTANVVSIDAVEIDPKIVEIGKSYHPEHPYSSPKVNIIIDDGRAVFKRTPKKYDLVIMGSADSHTLTSSLTNIRLDHYLYTQQSFEEVKRILKPDGLVFLVFQVTRPWIGERLEKTLTQVFGHEPIVVSLLNEYIYFGFGLGGIIYIIGVEKETINNYLQQNTDLQKFVEALRINYRTNINISSDNWPYLYLDKPRIPMIHLLISLVLMLIFVLLRRFVSWQGNFRWDFFLLGGGFLLYEFQNISKTSLLFGNTWTTNLFTITAILILGLLANLLRAKWKIPLIFSFIGQIIAFSLQFLVPLTIFNALSTQLRVIFGSLFLNLPLFFSALIFISLLEESKQKSAAFASSLIGSALGGMLEIVSFLLGINSVLIISLALYLFSFPIVIISRKARL